MRTSLPLFLRNIIACCGLLLMSTASHANHIVGADLYYTWITGNQYKVTFVIYGDCGSSASSTAFSSLPSAVPRICVYNGNTSITTLDLAIQSPVLGEEITPVCAADSLNTQCHSLASPNPGIKKFIYSTLYTVPSLSANWKFIFNGYLGGPTIAGRALALTNISSSPVTYIHLESTLNNTVAVNSNPALTILPTPFFCLNGNDNYNPGAVDADGDSLTFKLVPAKCGSGNATCDTGLGFVTYLTTYPYSGTNPLHTAPTTFFFDANTGQISFVPDVLQRSVVVYTINEYRNNVLVGTMQREMSFTVLTCTTPAPTGGLTSVTNGTVADDSHFYICAETGGFDITLTATQADTNHNITVSNTGVPPGCTFTVTNNTSHHPITNISWTSNGVTPGTYVFYVIFRDDACPINGQQTKAFTITIYPIPTLSYIVTRPATCAGRAIVAISPGGQGSPWTVKLLDGLGLPIDSVTGVTAAYMDTLAPGNDTLVIYSPISSFCNSRSAITIPPISFVSITGSFTSPTFCGNNNGSITIGGLNPAEQDTLYYSLNSVAMPGIPIYPTTAGTYTMSGLCAGIYSNIYVKFGGCVSPTIGPFTLINPPFTIDRVEYQSPTACGFNDGYIKVIGMRPNQIDTIKYVKDGVPQPSIVSFIVSDSAITISGLDAGVYTNILAQTEGSCVPSTAFGCLSNILGPITLAGIALDADYSYVVRPGCGGDTVQFTNLSIPVGVVPLYYRWYFGDGSTDTAVNPMHIFRHLGPATFTAKLITTNTRCIDTAVQTISLQDNVHASFTSLPSNYICQNNPVSFTNTSTGNALSYMWSFADGALSTSIDPSHTFANTGSYNVTLVATDNIGCKDTFKKVIQVDSTTLISMSLTDTVACKGSYVTFRGTYTNIGLQNTTWSFGDGSSFSDTNINPIIHSYDTVGVFPVTLTASYRACAAASATRYIKIYNSPTIDLGADTSICPGGDAIAIYNHAGTAPVGSTFIWNTGETTPSIIATQAGYYSTTITLDGCTASDTVWVANDCYINFPNMFTPNGDGINDYFFPRNMLTSGLIEFKMDIYNRWGQQIYSTKNLEGRGWDGKYNNEPQPQGVYIYQINAIFKNGQRLNKTGNITIVK